MAAHRRVTACCAHPHFSESHSRATSESAGIFVKNKDSWGLPPRILFNHGVYGKYLGLYTLNNDIPQVILTHV